MSSPPVNLFSRLTLMLIGSSIIERGFLSEHGGYATGLSHWYSRIGDVILRGQGGYNTRWVLQGLEAIVSPVPDLVVLFLGNNDAAREHGFSIPLDEYRDNVAAIIRKLHNLNPSMCLILVTPTQATKHGRKDETMLQYSEVIKSYIGKDERIAVIDTWHGPHAIFVASDTHDGLHFNADGNRKFLESIKASIRFHFPQYVPFTDTQESVVEASCGVSSASTGQEGIKSPASAVQLKWLFPRWEVLSGTTIEESRAILEDSLSSKG
jgi:lysophospholipase L1-like esterase